MQINTDVERNNFLHDDNRLNNLNRYAKFCLNMQQAHSLW
jgi:hypothetical protein